MSRLAEILVLFPLLIFLSLKKNILHFYRRFLARPREALVLFKSFRESDDNQLAVAGSRLHRDVEADIRAMVADMRQVKNRIFFLI